MNNYTEAKPKRITAFCHSIVNENQDTAHAIQSQKPVCLQLSSPTYHFMPPIKKTAQPLD